MIPYETSRKTCVCNLIPLCRHHHRLKTFGGWQVKFPDPAADVQPGTVIWRSPLGYRYAVPPADQPGSSTW